MTDDAAFLAAIKSAPNDDTLRLVYADWLDEQGRPGGEFLRIECQIAALDPAEFEQREQLRAKLPEEGVIDLAPPDFLGTYHWQRALLVAKLRGRIRGLDEDWVAAVCRVPLEEINARTREIQSWLRRRVSVAEMQAHMAEWDKLLGPRRSLWARLRGLFKRTRPVESEPQGETSGARWIREWAESHMQAGDELWRYDTGGDSWQHLCGEMGYAIVRGGKVVEFTVIMEN
jgi:uncharacterized protein (TIGR02996 family)